MIAYCLSLKYHVSNIIGILWLVLSAFYLKGRCFGWVGQLTDLSYMKIRAEHVQPIVVYSSGSDVKVKRILCASSFSLYSLCSSCFLSCLNSIRFTDFTQNPWALLAIHRFFFIKTFRNIWQVATGHFPPSMHLAGLATDQTRAMSAVWPAT